MTIASAPAAPPAVVAATGSASKKPSAATNASGEDAPPPFLALLQGQEIQEPAELPTLDSLPSVVTQDLSDALDTPPVTSGQALDTSAALTDDDLLPLADLSTLVGQTLHLDTQADRAVRDGVPAEPLTDSALASSASWGKPTQGLLTASLGVSSPVQANGTDSATIANAAQAVSLAAQSEQLEHATDPKNLAGLAGDTQAPDDPAEQAPQLGRIALHGMLDTGSPPPPLQAAASLVTQWAAQWLGAERPTTPRRNADASAEHSATATGLHSSGAARLTEQAVQAPQANHNAQWAQAQEQARQEDLRFWLQGQQQRAEVLVQRDGQPVRVQVQLHGQEAHVVLRTNQEEMRALLDDGMGQLREMLAQQGLQLAGAHVQADARNQEGSAHTPADGWGTARQATISAATLPQDAQPQGATTAPQGRLNVYA